MDPLGNLPCSLISNSCREASRQEKGRRERKGGEDKEGM